jgi:hypothetical protein
MKIKRRSGSKFLLPLFANQFGRLNKVYQHYLFLYQKHLLLTEQS